MKTNFQTEYKNRLGNMLLISMIVIFIILDAEDPIITLSSDVRSIVFLALLLVNLVHNLIRFVQFYFFSKKNKLVKINGELYDTKEAMHAGNTSFTATYKYVYEGKSGQTESYERIFPPINSHVTLYYDPVKDIAYINYFSFYLFRFAIVLLIGLASFIA